MKIRLVKYSKAIRYSWRYFRRRYR